MLPLPVALRPHGDGESVDVGSIASFALVRGEDGAEDSVLVRWELAPRTGAGQLLLLIEMHASIAALQSHAEKRAIEL